MMDGHIKHKTLGTNFKLGFMAGLLRSLPRGGISVHVYIRSVIVHIMFLQMITERYQTRGSNPSDFSNEDGQPGDPVYNICPSINKYLQATYICRPSKCDIKRRQTNPDRLTNPQFVFRDRFHPPYMHFKLFCHKVFEGIQLKNMLISIGIAEKSHDFPKITELKNLFSAKSGGGVP